MSAIIGSFCLIVIAIFIFAWLFISYGKSKFARKFTLCQYINIVRKDTGHGGIYKFAGWVDAKKNIAELRPFLLEEEKDGESSIIEQINLESYRVVLFTQEDFIDTVEDIKKARAEAIAEANNGGNIIKPAHPGLVQARPGSRQRKPRR